MARYLTPSKIVLLSLIYLYTDSLVPTAAAIPILSFIVSHLIPLDTVSSSYDLSTVSKSQSFIISIEDFQRVCASQASGIPGRTIWDLLLKRLWDIDSFDALHVFFDQLTTLLVRTREEQQRDDEQGIVIPKNNRILLSRVSPLGTFVRRAHLELVKNPFNESVNLWKNFISYRQSTWTLWKKRNPLASRESFDVNLGGNIVQDRLADAVYGRDLNQGMQATSIVSTDDLERLLEFQVDEMQSMT